MTRAASSASRGAWSRTDGPRWGASPASAWDRSSSSPMAHAASSARGGSAWLGQVGGQCGQRPDRDPSYPMARAASSASRSKGSVRWGASALRLGTGETLAPDSPHRLQRLGRVA